MCGTNLVAFWCRLASFSGILGAKLSQNVCTLGSKSAYKTNYVFVRTSLAHLLPRLSSHRELTWHRSFATRLPFPTTTLCAAKRAFAQVGSVLPLSGPVLVFRGGHVGDCCESAPCVTKNPNVFAIKRTKQINTT